MIKNLENSIATSQHSNIIMTQTKTGLMASAVIFCPQNSPPKSGYLNYIRTRLLQDPALKPLTDAIAGLPLFLQQVYDHPDGSSQHQTPVEAFRRWIQSGECNILQTDKSGIITLPLLVIIHIVQYLKYLHSTGLRHAELLEAINASGGIQGYCIGLLSAVVVASAHDEEEVARYAAAGICIALAIGAFGGKHGGAFETVQVRLKSPSDKDQLVQNFPESLVSAITDAKTVSFGMPSGLVHSFITFAETEGLHPRPIHIQSNLHNPNNTELARECCVSLKKAGLVFPSSWRLLQAPVRSNITGEAFSPSYPQSPTQELVSTTLTSMCNWSAVTDGLAQDLKLAGRKDHKIALFGFGDPIPLAPFQKHGLRIYKTHAEHTVTSEIDDSTPPIHTPATSSSSSALDSFPHDAIAIVGASCRLPGANSLDELWDIISQGQSRAEHIPSDRFDLKGAYRASQDPDWTTKREFFGNFIEDIGRFDHTFFGISAREASFMDPQQRLLLETAFEAMDSSGYMRTHQRDRGDPIGCFIGASYTEYLENTSAYFPSAFTATSTIRAFLSGKISYHFGWTGPSEVIDTACSASLVAVNRACQAIKTSECSMALAGGVNIITGVNNYFDLGKANFLSPTGQCKPFDESANGYCRADGVGLVVLKSLRQAVQDGDHIMGVISAVATNQGGLHASGITVPDGIAQKALYKRLLKNSGLEPDNITYVEAHGTGTRVGDPIEMDSIRTVFGGPKRASPIFLGSLKANIGHCETAAGVASLLKVLAMFRNRGIPPLQGFQQLNPKIPPLERDRIVIPTKLISWESDLLPRVACVNSYGASGSNSAVFCSEWVDEDDLNGNCQGQEFPILLSASSSPSLERFIEKLATYLSKSRTADIKIPNISFTLNQRRKHHRVRWATTASSVAGLVKSLQAAKQSNFVEITNQKMGRKKVVLVFSGQSRTIIGVPPSVHSSCLPRFEYHIQRCADILKALGCPDILPLLTQTEPINDPTMLQCGTVAVQYACAQAWIEAGLEVDAIVGHSLGELTALGVSGALSLEDMLKVVYTRAELIKSKWGPERGTMLAVHADEHAVQSIIKEVETRNNSSDHDEALEIACYNSHTSHVIVGNESSIAAAEYIIQQDARFVGTRHQRLDVSHGFHSRFTEPLLQEVVSMGMTIQFREPTIPIETSTLSHVELDANYLARHARDPVYFSHAVRRVEQQLGSCVWLEAGLGSPITAMTKRAVANPDIHAFQPVLSPAMACAELWRGECMDVIYWGFLSFPSSSKPLGKHIWLPPYTFDPHRHWLQHVDRAAEERSNPSSQTVSQRHQKLVTYLGTINESQSSHKFLLNTTHPRYDSIVRGHSIRTHPLCPASLYMEAAIKATSQLSNPPPISLSILTFQDLHFHRPLGCPPHSRANTVETHLLLSSSDDIWSFSVQSSPPLTHHASGSFTLSTSFPSINTFSLLVQPLIASLQASPSTERLKSTTAYSLFSRIVEYAPFLRGIQSMILGSNEALAQIKLPSQPNDIQVHQDGVRFDAVRLDTYIQVLGLLINTSYGGGEEIYVASKIGKWVILPGVNNKQQREGCKWKVYARCEEQQGGKMVSGGVWVFDDGDEEEGKNMLVSYAEGVEFVRVTVGAMERLLGGSNGGHRTRQEKEVKGSEEAVTAVDEVKPSAGPEPDQSNYVPTREPDIVNELKELISSYTGVPVQDMDPESTLSEMGLDSLAAMELADEIGTKLGLRLSSEELLLATVESVLQRDPSPASHPPACQTSPKTPIPLPSTGKSTTPSPFPSSALPSIPSRWTRVNHPLSSSLSQKFKIHTAPYKSIYLPLSPGGESIPILADIYLPHPLSPSPSQFQTPMPIALLIHGGGHLTLSRRAVRPHQIKYLLSHGILPVSIDYRLCPQINVVDGAMQDVRDACVWAQTELPLLIEKMGIGIKVDAERYVVVGWSTGGTLAMTTGWTTTTTATAIPQQTTLEGKKLRGPRAVLAFYCPVMYDPDDAILMGGGHEKRTMSLTEIREGLDLERPTTSHATNSQDSTKLGWVQAGDARSELVRALIKERKGMAVILNDRSLNGDELPEPDKKRAAEFSPLVHVRNGDYDVPTCIIFGDQDEIAPYLRAVELVNALEERSIETNLVTAEGQRHIFDLDLVPGTEGWERWVAPGYEFLMHALETNAS